MFDPLEIQADFPILRKKIHGNRLVYLDNAATSQKPEQVIEAIVNYYENHNANVHRGVHQLSEESTQVFEDSRKVIASFFHADDEELILVRNTTEGLNGIVYGWGLDHLKAGDVILSTEMEHHSNLVPWQELAKKTSSSVQLVNVTPEGILDLEDLERKIGQAGSSLALVALSHVSNTLGTRNPVEQIVQMIHQRYSQNKRPLIVVDGAQAAPHMSVDFHALQVDCYLFSGHKMLGPMGIGGLLVRKSLLTAHQFKPWLFGGGMIEAVYEDHASFSSSTQERFTAGTPDVASTVGLAQACSYLSALSMQAVYSHDQELVEYLISNLQKLPEIQVVGPLESERVGSVAFLYNGVHPHDVAQILDSEGIAVRSGHHCTMPLHSKFEWPGTLRASFQVYNTKEDCDALVDALKKVKAVFQR